MLTRYITICLVYCATYLRTIVWPWVGLDDIYFLRDNPNLYQAGSSVLWGLLDVDFGRRWTPLLWLPATFATAPSSLYFHLLSFFTGLIVCLLAYMCFLQEMRQKYAFVFALIFTLSPLRMENFGWQMGFGYNLVAAFFLGAIILDNTGKERAAMVCAMASLLVYPVAAGGVLFLAYRWREDRWRALFMVVAVGVIAVLQGYMRVTSGFTPFSPQWGAVFWVLPHYLLVQLWPVATMPITSAGYYPLLILGLALVGLWAAASPQKLILFIVALSPVLIASVTEPFYWAARYSMLPSLVFLLFLGVWFSKRIDINAPALLMGFAVALGAFTNQHDGFASPRVVAARVQTENMQLYGHTMPLGRNYGQEGYKP